MKRIYKSFCMSALALLISSVGFVSAQINYSQNWDTGDLNTWTTSGGGGTYSRNTTTPCAGAASVRANVYTSSPTFLISPALGGNTGGDLTVNFSYKWTTWSGNNAATGTQIDYIKVQWAATATGPFVDALVLPGSSHVTSSSCADASTTITGLPEGNIFIRFETKAASGADLYCYIDNVVITQGPGPYCPVPSALTYNSLTSNSVNIAWTPSTVETAWNVQWGTPGFTPGTGTEIGSIGAAGSPSASISTLSPGGTYHFYVQADCGAGDESSWLGPLVVTTPDVATPAPFYDDFSTSQWVPVGTGVNKWYIGSAVGNPVNGLFVSSTGTSYTYINNTASVAHIYKTLIAPAGAVGSQKIRFQWQGTAEGGSDRTRVWLIPATSNPPLNTQISATNTAGAVQLGGNLSGVSTWTDATYNVPAAFLGTNFKVVFEWRNDGSVGQMPTAIDNFALYSDVPSPVISQSSDVPTCVTGTNLSVVDVATSPIIYYWQTTATGTSTTNNASTPWTVFENGTYYVRAYNSFTQEWSTATSSNVTSIPTIANPPAPLAATNPACLPGTEIVMASAPAAGVEYYWQGTSNISSSFASNATTPYTVTETGTYYVKAFESASSCWSEPIGVTVTVNTIIPANPSVSTPAISACLGASSIEISGQVVGLPRTYKLRKLDSASDGWSGNSINLLVNGVVVLGNVTLASGGLGEETFTVAEGDVITTTWNTTGSWVGEVSYRIVNENNDLVGGIGSQNTQINYTVPMAAYTLTWYDAALGGNVVGTGNTLETIGSSVIGSTAVSGTYSFYLASNFGACESLERTLVNVSVTSVNVELSTENVSCNNGNDGTFEVTNVLCGNEPLTFSVDGGAFGAIPTDLTVGTHTVVVKDANDDESATYTITIGDAPAPYDVTEIATTNNQSTISWTAPGSEIQWNVVWGPIGFTPGDATQIGAATANDTTFVITDLLGNTEYDIFVSADCGNGTVAGDWNSVSVWTECDAYNLPFFESFEDNSASVVCWTLENASSGSWFLGVGSEDSGPVTTAYEGQQNAYYDNGSSGRLVSPTMLLNGQDSVAVIFAISQAYWPSDQNTTTLAKRNGTSGAWTAVKTYTDNIPQWMLDTVVVSTTGFDSLQLSFLAVDEIGYNNTIDNFIVESCYIEPTADGNITVCRSEGSIDLTSVVTPMASGVWNGGTVNSFVNGSMFNISNLMEGTYEIKHIAKTACAYDTAVVTITVTAPLSAGTDGTINVCKNQPIGLFTGLSGNVDYGGTWYNAAGVALTGSTFTTGTLQGQQVYTYVVSNGICDADTSTVIVNIGTCNFIGVDDVELFDNVTISPNPSTGVFNIEGVKSPDFTYEVVDMNGRIIKGETKITSSVTSVTLSTVETGVYMIRLKGEGSEKMIRLIKQ